MRAVAAMLAGADAWHLALWLAVMAVAAFVAGASACRINNLNPTNHKRTWSLMYLWMAGAGAGCFGFLAVTPANAELLALLGATQVGPALNLALTWRQWRAGLVPAIAQKPEHLQALADADFDDDSGDTWDTTTQPPEPPNGRVARPGAWPQPPGAHP